jgi:hypothetical protein
MLAALLASDSSNAGMRAEPTPETPQVLVRQIDHVLISSAEGKRLFNLFSETFQLPVAWTWADHGGFASGGISMDNLNLEIFQASKRDAQGGPSWILGFALEPGPLRTTLPALDALGITRGKPVPFRSRQLDGSNAVRWTTVSLPFVSSEAVNIFLCEYTHDVPARRRELQDRLRARSGGPLTILQVREVVYGTSQPQRMQERWQTLLKPVVPLPTGAWPLGAGPALRVVAAERDGIRGMEIQVRSLRKARECLLRHGLLGPEEPGRLTLAGPAVDGLNLTLVE